MMGILTSISPSHSTTRLCFKLLDERYSGDNGRVKEEFRFNINVPELKIKNSKLIGKPEDKFETMLFLPEGENRKGEGGLRTKGYFKFSYKKINGEWYIIDDEDKPLQKVSLPTEIKLNQSIEYLPLVTIITVVYNGEKYLEDTIKSVINQTYPNIEYIIIDGGSTDGTLDIIRKYEDYIDYWVSEKDSGIYDAMNKGITLSFGRGINFLNAGDFFVGDVINGEILLPSFLPVKYVNWRKKLVSRKIKDVKSALPQCHQGILFENKKLLYNTKFSVSADYDYFIRHGYDHRLPILRCNGYVFYNTQEGYSISNSKQREKEKLDIIKIHFSPYVYIKTYIYFKFKEIIRKILLKWIPYI